jgi:hypothetical protein
MAGKGLSEEVFSQILHFLVRVTSNGLSSSAMKGSSERDVNVAGDALIEQATSWRAAANLGACAPSEATMITVLKIILRYSMAGVDAKGAKQGQAGDWPRDSILAAQVPIPQLSWHSRS